MSDPNDWRRSWIDRASTMAEKADGADASALLRLIHEGIRLRRRLEEIALDPSKPEAEDLDELLETLEDAATAAVSSSELPAEQREALAVTVGRRLKGDQAYLTGLLTRPDLEAFRRAALLDRYRRDLIWLNEVVTLLDGLVPTHPTVTARIELDRIEKMLREDRAPELEPMRRSLIDRAEVLRRSLLDHRIEQLLARPLPEGTAAELWGLRLLLSRLQAEIETLPALLEFDRGARGEPRSRPIRHRQGLIDRREALAVRASEGLDAEPAERRDSAWDELLTVARGESNEILSILEEVSPAFGNALLLDLREDMQRLKVDSEASRLRTPTDPERPRDGHRRRITRRFGRMARVARNEGQEKQLADRLVALFGPRFPKRLDALILALILVLTALILVETAIDNADQMTPAIEEGLAWADLAICSVFLAEFGLKLALVRGRWLYFRRHALIDLLPSIPFGFIAHVLSGPTRMADVQFIRLLRIPRLVRYLRLLRPLIRLARLSIFVFRFTDRLIRRYANVFNRNIILFEVRSEREGESRNRHLLYTTRRHFERRAPEHFQGLDESQHLALAELALEDLRRRVEEIPRADWSERHEGEDRDIPIEEVVDRLIELTPEELIEQMGPTFVNAVDRYVRLFDVPIVRRLPLVAQILAHREQGPAESVALAANFLGYLMQRALDVVYFVADLQATVSPPLFLDKLGGTIVNATKRPAFRLLTFGLIFGALYAIVLLLVPDDDRVITAADGTELIAAEPGEIDELDAIEGQAGPAGKPLGLTAHFGRWLRGVLAWFAGRLGLPVVVIGVVCFALMQLGGWFRRIANQAAEFCERVVEAQFSAQTKLLKTESRSRDLRFIAERVTTPEVRLRTSDDLDAVEPGEQRPEAEIGGDLGVLEDDGDVIRFDGDEALKADPRLKASETAFFYTLRLLYRDYLDGSPFHRNDTKASTQLLGNLALRNLTLSDLSMFLRSRRRLDRLDLNRAASSLFGGPYLWFDYITRMIVQETAKLLIDYNTHAIPTDRLSISPEATRTRYRDWLASRLGVAIDEVDLPDRVGMLAGVDRLTQGRDRPEADDFFETVDFNAVDFLIADPDRDEVIRSRYGDQVVALIRRDRERNLRKAFRSMPLHRAPIARRTINVFNLYETFLAKGQLLLLPVRLVWWTVRGVALLVARVSREIKEILHPSVDRDLEEFDDSYQAAVRKIHRMRKPAFMESLWLRARFDVEYLGLALPSVPISVGSDSLMETDLDFIGASRHERVMADHYRDDQRRRLARVGRWLHRLGWDFDGLGASLPTDLPLLADRRGEVVRALVTAWVADHDDVELLGDAVEALTTIVNAAAGSPRVLKRLPDDLPDPPNIGEPLWHRLGSRRRSWRELLDLPCFPDLEPTQRNRVVRTLRKHRRRVRGWIRVVLGQGDADPIATLKARLIEVMLHTDLWSDQILTLRTIQTLTMLDVQHYTELVWRLGGFDRLDTDQSVTELPFGDHAEAEESVTA